MQKVKVSFYTTNMFNFKQEFTRDDVIVEVSNESTFQTYLKAETEDFQNSVKDIENELFGEEASRCPLMAHVDLNFFVDADAVADVYLS